MSNQDNNSGRFVTQSSVRSPIEVDCSGWTTDPESAPRSPGKFATQSSVRPAAEGDCSRWTTSQSSLELTLTPGEAADAIRFALGMLDILSAINRLDRTLGGTGLTKHSAQQVGEAATIILVPDESKGAPARLEHICEVLNRAAQDLTEIPFPAAVKSLVAHVA